METAESISTVNVFIIYLGRKISPDSTRNAYSGMCGINKVICLSLRADVIHAQGEMYFEEIYHVF